MFKMNTTKKILLAFFCLLVLFVGFICIKFINLKEYEWNGNLITQDDITYQDSPELFIKYLNGEIETEGITGRFKGDKFWGFKTWVLKLKGIEENEAFLIRGLMYEGVYVRNDT